MKFILNSSLQQMALVKIAEQLWNKEDIRNLFTNSKFPEYFDNFNKEWQEVEVQVALKVPHLSLPDLFKKDLLRIIGPIGHQMLSWCMYHIEEYQILRFPEQFSWTPKGTIDRKRTAETLVKNEDIDIQSRYKLSCINCLEDKIPELWNQIPNHQRLNFYYILINNEAHTLVEFWTYRLFGEGSELEELITRNMGQRQPSHVYALEYAVKRGNVVATEFFYHKLSDVERDTLLVPYARCAAEMRDFVRMNSESYSEVFHFLLSRMSEDQQIETLNNCHYHNFQCFLDWPFQPFFMATVELIKHVILNREYATMLELITSRIVDGWNDFDYQQLFDDFRQIIPFPYNYHYILLFRRLLKLFEDGQDGILKSMLNDTCICAKQRLMLTEGQYMCVKLVEKERWSSLELFIRQCAFSKEMVVWLKKEFMKPKGWGAFVEWYGENSHKWENFFSFLDDLFWEKCEEKNAKNDENNP